MDLVKNGRANYQRVLTWVINKVSRTILKTGFVVVPFLVTGKFVISALGMVLLVFMTDFVKIALATDRVRPSQTPETWNIGPLVKLAVALGVLMLIESLGLLAIGWRWFGLANDDGRLPTFAFLTLLFFALFSLVSIRERRRFWSSRPSGVLATALAADGCVGILIGTFGLGELAPLPATQTACVIGYALACSLVINEGQADVLVRVPATRQYREKLWDHAAGTILVEEAGGRVTDLDGVPLDFAAGQVLARNEGLIASNAYLHTAALNAVRRITR